MDYMWVDVWHAKYCYVVQVRWEFRKNKTRKRSAVVIHQHHIFMRSHLFHIQKAMYHFLKLSSYSLKWNSHHLTSPSLTHPCWEPGNTFYYGKTFGWILLPSELEHHPSSHSYILSPELCSVNSDQCPDLLTLLHVRTSLECSFFLSQCLLCTKSQTVSKLV